MRFIISYQNKPNDSWTGLDGTVRPFSLNDTLDETLDSGLVEVTGLASKPLIKPFALVKVEILGNGQHTRFFRAGSIKTVKRRYQENAYVYDLKVELVELTKELERVVCDTMTFTNFLGKEYVGGSSIAPKPAWTITGVINRLLSSGKTRRDGIEPQKYSLNATDATYYNTIKAPEYYITRKTMYEALLEVGGTIHAIPRLNFGNTVSFTKLGGNEAITITAPLIYEERELNAEDYCGAFDSIAQNMINTIDVNQGAVVDPSHNAFKTVRAVTTETKINADTMAILLNFPINQIIKLEVSVVINGVQNIGDITSYVYEQAEYKALSEYTGTAYPYSKAYALTYTQGDTKITGLNFRITGSNSISTAFQKFAIYNIVKSKFNLELGDDDYINLGFRVTYIPIITGRYKQFKPNTTIPTYNELIYNQNGNSVESYYYGEKLKGAVARLGNETVSRTYLFSDYGDIPRVGQLVNVDGVNMYIAVINMQLDTQYIRATLIMTPNYNKLSEWIGFDSNVRFYEISEKQSVERLMNYSERCVISNSIKWGIANEKPMINEAGIRHIRHTFSQTIEGFMKRPTAVWLLPLQGETIVDYLTPICLPLATVGVGNSLAFSFNMADNYSAGYQAKDLSTPIIIENRYNRLLRNVAYGDAYGQITNFVMSFIAYSGAGTATEQTDFNGRSNLLPQTESVPYSIADNVTFEAGKLNITTGKYDNAIIVNKDSREDINFTFQLHFQTDDSNIIVGTSLIQNNLIISPVNPTKAGRLYFLPNTVNMLQTKLDLTGAYDVGLVGDLMTQSANLITIASVTNATQNTYKAWAIVNPLDNTYYLAKNETLAPNQATSVTYLNFLDNSYLEE